MNHSIASPTVSLQISARSGRLDPAIVGRITEAVVGALSDHTPPERPAPSNVSQPSKRPAETAA